MSEAINYADFTGEEESPASYKMGENYDPVAAEPEAQIYELKPAVRWDAIESASNEIEEADNSGPVDGFKHYMNEAGKLPLLTPEEEISLAKKIEKGDLEAKTKMIESNLKLVTFVAKNYLNRGFSLESLQQEGSLGLIRAAEKFDYRKGYRFSTYATWWIRQGITRALADKSRTIRIPVHVTGELNKLNAIERRLTAENGREPTVSEIAEAMEMPPEKIEALRNRSKVAVSLDQTAKDGEETLGQFVADESIQEPIEIVNKNLVAQAVHDAIARSRLNETERLVVRCRFGLDDDNPMTLKQLGELLGITSERVRQIEASSIEKLGQDMEFKRAVSDR